MTSEAFTEWLWEQAQRAGFQSWIQLAETLGVRRESLWKWTARGYVPASRLVQVAEVLSLSKRNENVLRMQVMEHMIRMPQAPKQ